MNQIDGPCLSCHMGLPQDERQQNGTLAGVGAAVATAVAVDTFIRWQDLNCRQLGLRVIVCLGSLGCSVYGALGIIESNFD